MNWLSQMINSQPKRKVDNGNLPKEKRATGHVYHCPNEEKQRLSDNRHLEVIGNQTLSVREIADALGDFDASPTYRALKQMESRNLVAKVQAKPAKYQRT